MKHTECKDCELSNGDCGHHFKMDGIINYDIASLSACDRYGNCDFFKPKANGKASELLKSPHRRDFICSECQKDADECKSSCEYGKALDCAIKALEAQGWIPVTERLPVNTNPVNITWVNHQPESYYADIKDKPFTATGCFCDGKWYWYSSTCQDYLIYYRDCPFNAIDEGIEVLAWMPLPKPYTKEETT